MGVHPENPDPSTPYQASDTTGITNGFPHYYHHAEYNTTMNRIKRNINRFNNRSVNTLLIIFGVLFGAFAVTTLLLWTAGFVPARSFKENEQVTTCHVSSVNTASNLCSYKSCVATDPRSHVCTSYSTTYYTCYDVVGTVWFTDLNGTVHTFTVSYYDVTHPLDIINEINAHNGKPCYYDKTDMSRVSFTEPNPTAFIISGSVFAGLTGVTGLVLAVLGAIRCVAE